MATATTTIPPRPTSLHADTPNLTLSTLQRQGFSSAASSESQRQLLPTRSGAWPYVRTVPKQFPPWPEVHPSTSTSNSSSAVPNIWGIQHLLHPSMPHRLSYASIYFSSAVLDIVKSLLDLPLDASGDDELVMELMQLLVSPSKPQPNSESESGNGDFQLIWHRDDIQTDVSPEEEAKLLHEKSPGGTQKHVQYNIALTGDESLIVVPGSHRRVRTQREREATGFERLEGQIVVKLAPGDAVFYDSNILHRAEYKGVNVDMGDTGRMTLHGSVGVRGFGKERARNVLQHGVGRWIGQEGAGFQGLNEVGGEEMERRAEGMRKRLIEMGIGEGVGYSLN